MKEKILAQLVIKYPGVSKLFLGLLATQLATTVTEESGIDAALTTLDNAPIPIATLAAEFQKEGDRRVTDAKKEFLKNPPKPDDKTDPPPIDPPPATPQGEEPPAWAKALIDQNKALEEKLTAFEKEKSTQSIAQKLAAHAKLKDIPAAFWNKRALPTTEDAIDAFADEAATDWTALNPAGASRPITGGSGTTGKPSDAEVKELKEAFK